ncbi:MAG: metallophosphoesterase [Bacteroidaceae bacterium]|nr:metallophosphoesterase [Bacteroidaceae bacterium]
MTIKKNTLLLAALACMLGTNLMAQDGERLTFGVISDTHFNDYSDKGPVEKVSRALKNLTRHAALDVLVDVGDVVNNGRASEYVALTKVFGEASNFTNPVGQFLFVMGGHEYLNTGGENAVENFRQGLKSFNGGEPYPLNHYTTVKGYPFITIAMNHWYPNDTGAPSHGFTVYPVETQQWLDEMMERASTECPGKPIFVFTHVPPRWTVYGAWPEYENGGAWCMKVLNPILNKYPQAVVFAGHSHYPIGDPRSIHQGTNPESLRQNYYTVINTGSTTYGEIHPGAVEEGNHPAGYTNVTEGMILTELENGDIEIRRYDTFRDEEIGAQDRWVLKAPFDGSQFQYADIRDSDDNPGGRPLRNGLPAPVFAEDAKISVSAKDKSATVTFSQATDNECVFRYRIRLIQNGLGLSEKYVFSQFYLNSATPQTLDMKLTGLTPGTEYRMEVNALDSYDNVSEPLAVTFTTPGTSSTVSVPEADGQWTFDDAADLMKCSAGNLTIAPALATRGSVKLVATPAQADIVPVDGPSSENGAILVPKNSALMVQRKGKLTANWTLMTDFKVEDASIYDCIIQTNLSNSNDGDLFVLSNMIGMGAMGGYFGRIENDTWCRVFMTNSNGTVRVYVNGEQVLSCPSQGRWEIEPEGFLLFCDEDGEVCDTYVAEVAYWEVGLTEDQVRALSGREAQIPYVTILTPSIKVVDQLDFTITIDANMPFTFELPEWIEPVDVQPFLGKHAYKFRARALEEYVTRSGVIRVVAEGMEVKEIPVEQHWEENTFYEPVSIWTFDNANDPLGGTGEAVLRGAKRGANGPEVVDNPASAGIVPVAGPTESDGAVTVPFNSYLQMAHNQAEPVQNTFTILMDVKPKKLSGYNVLFQSDPANSRDASLFILDNCVGIGSNGLGYNGNLIQDKWHRIVFAVENNVITLYQDGTRIGQSSSANSTKWQLRDVCYFFADEDGEEGDVNIAELCYWNVPIPSAQVKALSTAGKPVAIENISAGREVGQAAIYDLTGRRVEKPVKGLYIINAKKVLVK